MAEKTFLNWPFFSEKHRVFAKNFTEYVNRLEIDHSDIDAACRNLVTDLGENGWLNITSGNKLDVRSLCLSREILAYHDGLADFVFAMQGLGTGAISLFGTKEQKSTWLPLTKSGKVISAFALTEPQSGSDVANSQMTAIKVGNEFVLNGKKTWISNGGIADLYTVFARTGEAPKSKGLSAFIVPGDTKGLYISERQEVISPHPLATVSFEDCRIPASNLIGLGGEGFKIAMSVLDVFRSTVAAAALGFSRRALDEAINRVNERKIEGVSLFNFQLVQGHIAEMAVDIDAAALLIYRAAWTKDQGVQRITREAAMAKLFATEQAQQIIDKAVQLFGGDGVRKGEKVEELYRDIRALRIYEGATDIQKIVIAKQVMSSSRKN